MSERPARAAAVFWVAVAVMLAACGGSGTNNPSAAANPTLGAGSTEPDPPAQPTTAAGQTQPISAGAGEAPPPQVAYAGQVTPTPPPTATPKPAPTAQLPTGLPAATAAPLCSVSFLADAFFDTSQAQVTAPDQLVKQFATLRGCATDNTIVVIEGWTDDRGDADDNVELALARVAAVVEIVVAEWPELAGRIRQVAHGEVNPPTDCTGDCPANRVVIASVVPER